MLRPIFRLLVVLLASSCVLACARLTTKPQEASPIAHLKKIAVVVLAGQDIPTHESGPTPNTEEITAGIAALD
ncbi:MAG: hypothetical protein KKD73_14690, partial [Proteobacteria bacterium]|nr:hypothetical protein [Pseudomonadota bacterium]